MKSGKINLPFLSYQGFYRKEGRYLYECAIIQNAVFCLTSSEGKREKVERLNIPNY